MILFRYMVGDVLAGGCVLATNETEAESKVRAFYDELAAISGDNTVYTGAEITVWQGGDGFIEKFPDAVEVYP